MGINENNELFSVPVGIFETLYKLKLTGTEYKIILCIIRYTFNFNIRYCPLSLSFLSDELNTPKRNILNGLNNLEKKQLITNYKDKTKKRDVNLWGLSENFFTLPNIQGGRQ